MGHSGRWHGPGALRVGMISQGCVKELLQIEVMLGHRAGHPAETMAHPGDAEVIVANACCSVENARREPIKTIPEVT